MVKTTLVGALNTAIRRSMSEDPRVVVMGEDVARLGGVFRVTAGLREEFGEERVIDTLLAESSIVGAAIGLAMRGFRPVCEIQFDGFVYPAFNQIVSQLAKMHARTAGKVTVPIVIRIPVGGGIHAVEHHSESNEAYFAHTAGLRVVSCSNPADAYGMLREAIASDDPVIFYEPKRNYWESATFEASSAPQLSISEARTVRSGTDCTVVAHGPTMAIAEAAAIAAEEDGYSIEVIDLRSISPLPVDHLVESVVRTGRLVVVHEAPTFFGLGGEISAAVTERAFSSLQSPVMRVGAYNLPYPPATVEDEFLPTVDKVLEAIDAALHYQEDQR